MATNGTSAEDGCGDTDTSEKQRNAGLRWVPIENFHLTLNFLGAVEFTRIAPIKRVLAEVVRGMGYGSKPRMHEWPVGRLVTHG